jgi:hypothetical protein
MNLDKVLTWAKECGDWNGQTCEMNDVGLQRFAALVATAAAEKARADYEREHCRHAVPLPGALSAMVDDAVAAEREACAKVCDSEAAKWPYPSHGNAAATIAATAIRARVKP